MKRIESRVGSIKTAQRESVIFRTVSSLFCEAIFERPELQGIFVNRVQLSGGKGMCYIYFYSSQGKQHFESVLKELVLYKPSVRKAIAQTLDARRAVDIIFAFDDTFERIQRIEGLIESIKAHTPNDHPEE